MNIRHAKTEDIETILEIYEYARKFMAETGNPNQWVNGYPSREIVCKDMENNVLYVCEEKKRIIGVFAFIPGTDPTYLKIYDGSWNSDEDYGTIHRIASDGTVKEFVNKCVHFCLGKSSYLRIDTHEDNKVMQRALKKIGYRKCGTVYLMDGRKRIAYDYIK